MRLTASFIFFAYSSPLEETTLFLMGAKQHRMITRRISSSRKTSAGASLADASFSTRSSI
jgi:hypothetical protein